MKKLFVAALAAVTMLSSCSKDDNGANSLEGADTKMGLSFTVPAALESRTIPSYGEDITANEDENQVKTVHVFIFKSDGTAAVGNITKKNVVVSGGVGETFTKSENTYTLVDSEKIKTTAGPKTIYIGINLPDALAATLTSKSAVESTKAYNVSNLINADKSVAMFSNAITKTLNAWDEGTSTPINEVETDVQRMVAKVAVQTENETFESTFSGSDQTVTYTIEGSYIYQTSQNIFPAQQVTGNVLSTPVGVSTGAGDYVAVNAKTVSDFSTMTSAYVGENAPAGKLAGEATYALVRTVAAPSHHAVVVSDEIEIIPNGTFTTLCVVHDGEDIYFCQNETEASAVAAKLEATYRAYPGNKVYFLVWLNKETATDPLAIYRNQFIHVLINGVTDDVFNGIPGKDANTPPEDPTDEDEPNTPDPEDPIVETNEDAFLKVKVTVKPWFYSGNSVILQ